MTIIKKVKESIKNCSFYNDDPKGINELIAFAYYLGRHEAATECCDQTRQIFKKQLERAKNSRYHKKAREIQGNITQIYHSDYSGDFIDTFCEDDVKEELI